jgi:hypothetical protein
VFVLSINEDRFESLTDEQQGWVREAAEIAVQASVDATFDESAAVQSACEEGSRFVDARAGDLIALRAAFAPIIDRLAADDVDGPLLAEIQAIAAEHPGPESLDVPESCRVATASAIGGASPPNEVSGLPDGTYRVRITLDDLAAERVANNEGWTGTWTLRIEGGEYQLTCQPVDDPGRDCGNTTFEGPPEAGYVKGTGDVVHFVYDAELHSALTGCALPCFPLSPYSVRWSLDGDVLTFSDSEPFVVYDKVLKPWNKID